MNISGLIKGFLGDAQPSEPKKLELKSGEVVKGMVVQQLSEQEAILNIGGVQVRAKLETPLKQGEVTMLQVQPESASGQIVLKPLDASAVKIADGSLTDILKNLGLPDNSANRLLIQAMHQAGISLSKENVQAFSQLQAQMPPSMPQEQWAPSAILAFQKGIPLTPESVIAVRQAVSGPAFHETLEQLDSQMSKLLNDDAQVSPTTREAIEKFKQVLASLREASGPLSGLATGDTAADLPEGAVRLTGNHQSPSGSATGAPAASGTDGALDMAKPAIAVGMLAATGKGANATGSTAALVSHGASEPPSDIDNPKVVQSQGTVTADADSPDQARSASAMTKPATGQESLPSSATMPMSATAPQPNIQGQASVTAAGQGGSAAVTGENDLVGADLQAEQAAGSTKGKTAEVNGSSGSGLKTALTQEEAPSGPTASTTPGVSDTEAFSQKNAGTTEHWIPKLMKALGVEHEHQLFKLPEQPMPDGSIRMDGAAKDAIPLTGSAQEQLKTADTLKSVLMQLAQADDIPAAMKESVQQAVQQITGQQLMLNSDKSSMFSHITMFVPLLNANGEQTAAIHIQSRKGKRGEIDVRNCRLVFDLRMAVLGDTIVDVKVVDRIVSLHVLNDRPFVQELLESYRDEIAAGLSGIGYQFISLKCSPYPEKAPEESQPTKPQESGMPGALQAFYGSKPYRGMDVRV